MTDFDLKAELKVLQDFQMKNCDLSDTVIAINVYSIDSCAYSHERKLEMKTKYARLIEQLDRVTAAYSAALSAVLNLEEMVSEQNDLIGISGGVSYFGDAFEKNRAIQLGSDVFTIVALDCGSDVSYENKEDKGYVRFCCTVFGYRVFALIDKGSAAEAYLMDMVARGE